MLRVIKGRVIDAYGPGSNPFTDESELSQPVLAHLQTRFPDDIEEVDASGKTVTSKKEKAKDVSKSSGSVAVDLAGKSNKELQALAKGFEGYNAKLTKDQLMELIEKNTPVTDPPPVVDEPFL